MKPTSTGKQWYFGMRASAVNIADCLALRICCMERTSWCGAIRPIRTTRGHASACSARPRLHKLGVQRWTARRKSALVLEIIQGKTTVAEASRAHDLPPSELEKWIASHGVLPTNEEGADCAGALRSADQADDRGEPLVRLPHGGASAGLTRTRFSAFSSSNTGRYVSGRWASG